MHPNFTDLRSLHQQRQDAIAQQREQAIRDAASTVNLLTSIVQAPGYKLWKDAVLASATAEHQKALKAPTAHEMAVCLGAEGAYRAAAHAAEDIIASCQTATEAMKAR